MATRANKMNWMKGFNEEENRNAAPYGLPRSREPFVDTEAQISPTALSKRKGSKFVPVTSEENGEARQDWYDEASVTPEMQAESDRINAAVIANRKKTAKNRAMQRPAGGNKRMTK